MKILILPLIALTGILSACGPTQTLTKERFVQASIPPTLMDCDRLKSPKINPAKLTNKQIAYFITHQDSIIKECFRDVKDLRSFLTANNIIIEKYNGTLK